MIVSAFVEVLLPILVVVACGYALRIAAASTLVIVLIGALTYVCARPLRLDLATLSALLLSTQTENQSSLHPALLELPDAVVQYTPHQIARMSLAL